MAFHYESSRRSAEKLKVGLSALAIVCGTYLWDEPLGVLVHKAMQYASSKYSAVSDAGALDGVNTPVLLDEASSRLPRLSARELKEVADRLDTLEESVKGEYRLIVKDAKEVLTSGSSHRAY